MKYPQPTPPEGKNAPVHNAKAAEKAFIQFIRQIAQKQAKGFISEGEEGKIFSYETWLRETGHEDDVIAGYCDHVKAVNMLEKAARKKPGITILYEKGFLKGLLFILGILLVPTLLMYILAATLLLIFGVSLWNGSAFLSFTAIGMAVMVAFFILKTRKKKEQKNGGKATPQPLYVIKYFDNDELVFARAKSRLFVEK